MGAAPRSGSGGRGLRIAGRVFAVALGLGLALCILVAAAPAAAEAEHRVATLTKSLSSRSEKTRLSAVLALAKLGEPETCKPLVTALADSSPRVRAVAATALGALEYTPALATLRRIASDDGDPDVRKAAGNAALKLGNASTKDARGTAPRLAVRSDEPQARRGPSGGHPAALVAAGTGEPHPDLYLLVNSAADDSPGSSDKKTREQHAQIIKRTLLEQLRTESRVTLAASDARRWGLAARHIDLSVTRLEVTASRGMVEVDAQLRLAISDDNGKLISFLTGGARVSGRGNKPGAQYLPGLRRTALENAMRGMFDKLLAHLHDQPPP